MTATLQERSAPAAVVSHLVRPDPARAKPGAILALIGAGAVATLALWWRNTPSIDGFGDWLTNAGRVTGLLAGYGVVVLVALMARIPPLERGIGADRLARWHSKGGRYIVSLVVAHGLLIVWGYAVTAHTNLVSQTSTLLMSYPDVLAATIAGLLLLGVGISSARAARRRLRYETWYYLIPLPGQPPRRPRLPPRARGARAPARRQPAVPRRAPGRAGLRPSLGGCAEAQHSRTGRARRLSLRADRDDGRDHRRAACRRCPPPPDPPRVLRVLMRRVVVAAVSTIVGLVMLLSFKTHALPTTLEPRPAAIADVPSTTTTTSAAGVTRGGTSGTSTTTISAPAKTVTVTGNSVATRYGPVTVQVTVTNGVITAVDAVEYPTAKSRDVQINQRAVPLLNREALAAQSANIHTISGATYTSNGYVTSLQSALDKAGRA